MNHLPVKSAAPAITLLTALCCTPTAFAAPPVVKIDGSSTVFPITEAVAEEFQKARRGAINVTVGISGTGGGFKKFCRGETDIANASRPILRKEMDDCTKSGIRYYEMPVAYDALTVMVNPQNSFIKSMTVAELRKIWEPAAQGRINNWKDVNPAWPDQKIKLYGAGSDSGTFDYFTEAIVGKAKSSRGDYTASEDDNVLVQGISGDKGALGYFGFAYYIENQKKLKAVAIDNGKGPVAPTPENVDNGTYQPLVTTDLHLRQREVARQARDQGVRRLLHEERPATGQGSEVHPATGQGLHRQPRAPRQEEARHRLRRPE
jgi:phosphate transport system substrate-binding protein